MPTATSVRVVPAGLLEVNRRVANNYLVRVQRQGKISFTHLIGWAVVRALAADAGHELQLRRGRREAGRSPPHHVNLGLAVDVAKSDGSHSLLVPNIKGADTLDFDGYFAAYEDLIRRVRGGKIGADDFAGTTVTLTNPGTIGTVHSVPRLMPGQGVIIGVGTIDYPAEYQGADPRTLARLGLGKVVTLTSTYDHRIIQGAESGEFLRYVHEFLLGAEGFYDEVFASLRVPYEPARWKRDSNPDHDAEDEVDKQARVLQLINIYRVRGHLIADLDPLGRKGARRRRSSSTRSTTGSPSGTWNGLRHRRAGRLQDDEAGRHPGRAARRLLADRRHRVHAHPGAGSEGVDPGAGRGARVDVPLSDKRRILERLNAAEAFERFLHTKYLGHKRFGLEGAESLIPHARCRPQRGDRRADGGSGAGHGPPRPAQRAGQHRGQVVRPDLPGVRGRTSTRRPPRAPAT